MKQAEKNEGPGEVTAPAFVALKIIHEGHRDSVEDEIRVFEALEEGEVAGGGIIELHEVFEEDGRVCLAFELHGRPLFDMVEEAPLPLAEVKSVGRQMTEALRKLHEAGFAHTDLKTENILYQGREAKLIDFSTADDAMEKGDDFGTREYRAPEVILGGEVGPMVDIWSLGCCVFELLSGDYLFDPHGSLWARRKKSGAGQEEWKRMKAAVAGEAESSRGDSFSAGDTLGGKYRLEEEIGEGHFSIVWKARVLRDGPAEGPRAGGKKIRASHSGEDPYGGDDVSEEEDELIDEYDLVLDRELLWLIECSLGEYPRERARRGTRFERFFDGNGKALSGWEVEFKSIGEALVEFYGAPEEIAKEAEAFIRPMLAYDPKKRPTAAEILEHEWLADFPRSG